LDVAAADMFGAKLQASLMESGEERRRNVVSAIATRLIRTWQDERYRRVSEYQVFRVCDVGTHGCGAPLRELDAACHEA
jgi:hypothetical protein